MGNKLTPVIRFKGFKEDWEQRKLGDISEIKTGPFGSTLHAEDYIQSGIPIITTEHFKNGNLPESKNGTPQVSEEDYLRLKSYVLKEGDIVFSRVGSVDINALVTSVQDGWLFSGRVLRVRSQNQLDSDYIHYLLGTLPVRNDVISRAVGQTMPSINTQILKDTKIILSKNIEEQRLISNTLRKLDNILALQERKLELLKIQKKGYLQKMFPKQNEKVPELRFKGFNDAWEQRKLGEVAEFNPKSSLPDEFEYVDLESVVGTSLIDHRAETKESAPSRAQRLAQKNDVFYQTVRPYQKNNFLFDLPYDNYVFSTGYAQLRPKSSSYFLLNILQEEKFINKVLERCTGTSYPAINSKDLSKIIVYYPTDNDEQTKIGSFFKQLDETITLQERKLESMKEMKKGFLQKLFV